jgi:hypothetical protein
MAALGSCLGRPNTGIAVRRPLRLVYMLSVCVLKLLLLITIAAITLAILICTCRVAQPLLMAIGSHHLDHCSHHLAHDLLLVVDC